MNGAAPVLERMISRPTRSSTTTIGVIHQALLCNRKSTSSRKRLGDDCSAWRAKSSDLDGLFVVMRLALPNSRLSVRPESVLADQYQRISTGGNSGQGRVPCGEASSKSLPRDRSRAPSDHDRSTSL